MKIALYGFMGAGKSSLGKGFGWKIECALSIRIEGNSSVFTREKVSLIFWQLKGELFFKKRVKPQGY